MGNQYGREGVTDENIARQTQKCYDQEDRLATDYESPDEEAPAPAVISTIEEEKVEVSQSSFESKSEYVGEEQLRYEEMLVYSQIQADKLAEQAEEEEKNEQLIASYAQEKPARIVDANVPKAKTIKKNAMISLKDKNQKIIW